MGHASVIAGFFRRDPDAATESFDVEHEGALYRVRVRRMTQARRYTLRVMSASRDVVLTIPARAPLRDARAFVNRHGGWIAARVARLPDAVPFEDGALIPLRGVLHRIEARPASRGVVWIEQGLPGGRPTLVVAGDVAHLPRRVTDFLKRQARADLVGATKRHAAVLGVAVKAVTLRDQKSRWGSCSSRGAIAYSWRLIFAPSYVLDYLAAHEVSHIVELNHSLRFWRTVRRLYPDYERAEAWLKHHGAELHRYGA